jgi:hypothetical protein
VIGKREIYCPFVSELCEDPGDDPHRVPQERGIGWLVDIRGDDCAIDFRFLRISKRLPSSSLLSLSGDINITAVGEEICSLGMPIFISIMENYPFPDGHSLKDAFSMSLTLQV